MKSIRLFQTLDSEQMKLLVESEGAKNALWLSMACEELRVFGFFDLLTGFIKDLPSLLDDLLEKILTRLVKEDETNLLKKVILILPFFPLPTKHVNPCEPLQ